jgi:hypothetical protein
LSGNSHIVDLVLDKVPDIDGLVLALGNNNSLLRLAFSNTLISEDKWTALCKSLASHSTLVHLRLHRTFPHEPAGNSLERNAHRTSAFLQMLQANTALQELDARDGSSDPQDEFDERILVEVIQPYFRRLPHVRAFGKCRGPEYAQALARALYKVDESPALTWMLIRSNIPAILGMGEENEEDMVPDTKADAGGRRYLENEGHT